jgi:NADPH-dependent curcumin reductase CurA
MMNRRIVLASRPTGIPAPENFTLVEEPVRELKDGEVLLENLVFAIDPATRGMLDDRESYLPAVALGGVIPTMVLGRIVQSLNPNFKEGDLGRGYAGWEDYAILDPGNFAIENVKADPRVPLTTYMGALGWSGFTAFIGLKRIGEMTSGETVVMSAAAGAVGSVGSQIAKLYGNRVVGIVGSAEKARIVTQELGCDAAVNYRETGDLSADVRAACGGAADIYFDNVGGKTLETMLPLMRDHGRVVICGMVSDYNRADAPYPVRTLWQVLVHRVTMRGFLAYEYPEVIAEAEDALTGWIVSGRLKPLENVTTGLQNAPAAFIRLMSGKTVGKTVVRLNEGVSAWTSHP